MSDYGVACSEDECTCGGNCGTCQDAVGYDPEIWCPSCPIHKTETQWTGEDR